MRIAPLLLCVVALNASAATPSVAETLAEYDRLGQRLFSAVAVEVPRGGITIRRDTAAWTLNFGRVWIAQPGKDGSVSGLVFEGDGRFVMSVPDPVERDALARFANRKIEGFDEPFTQLVLRTSDDSIRRAFAPPAATRWARNDIATGRHDHWIVALRENVDAAIVAAARNPGALKMTAATKTAGSGWLNWDYDSEYREELRVVYWNAFFPETWISLDRQEDRTPEGRPTATESARLTLDHLDLKADLTRHRFSAPRVGHTRQQVVNGRYVVTATFTGVRPAGALRLWANPESKALAVREGERKVEFIRDHIGKRSLQVDDDVWDGEVVLLLEPPLVPGEQRHITFEYELETANYALGGSWYPEVPDSIHREHTARLELTVPKSRELRSMGRRVESRDEGENRTTVWLVEKPAKMVTFSTSDKFAEAEVRGTGVPVITTFGWAYTAWSNEKMMRNVAGDVSQSIAYFQKLFDSRLDAEHMWVTNIAARHGQAFENFLHLSENTFRAESPGASELFRAHEVAHQWWGHRIGWLTYRDQWLSEAFAEYSAMMFVESEVKGGDRFFEEILDSYEGIVHGDYRGGFSKFARSWLVEMNPQKRAQIGPIDVGWRANTLEMPAGYFIQSYVKGPLLLHMIRQLLFYRSGSDDLFLSVLREYVGRYSGRAASTDDFRRVLEGVAPADWAGWFRSWVGSAHIPSYLWSWRQSGDSLVIAIQRREVPAWFTAFLPFRIDYEDGSRSYVVLSNQEPEKEAAFPVTKRVKNVVFGPGHSVLARVSRR